MADPTTPEPGERSFEDLLADPHEQFNLPPELLASIMAYSTAPSGTVGAQPLQPATRLVCLPAAELAGQPGDDVHRRTVEHLGRAWPDLTEDPVYLEQLAHEVLSVRWEHAAHLAARLEHALAELSSLRDHRARWQVEHERAERAEATIERARNAFDGTTPGATGNSKLDALLQRASNGHVSTDDAQNLGRIVTEFLDRLARIQAALEGGE